MIGGGSADEDEDGEMADSAKALADMLRQGAGRTMIVSQILTRKAIDKLASIARGEPQDEAAPAAMPRQRSRCSEPAAAAVTSAVSSAEAQRRKTRQARKRSTVQLLIDRKRATGDGLHCRLVATAYREQCRVCISLLMKTKGE